jgi:hypothetical protein
VASAIPPSFLSHRSSSLSKSHSGSSRSPSLSSTVHHSLLISGQSSGRVASEGPSSLTMVQKEALLTFLGISTDLHSLPPTLRNTYMKYKALINASKPMQGLRSSQEWTDHLDEHGVEHWVPVFVDLVNVFIAKSQFYSSWKGLFSRAQNYPQMKAWLDANSDAESDSEIWAETKDTDNYTIVDSVRKFSSVRFFAPKTGNRGPQPV